jgi:hypothetical protein
MLGRRDQPSQRLVRLEASMVHDLRERLDVWTSAGLLAPDQADAIARYEAEHPSPETAGQPPQEQPPRPPTRRVLPAEAIGYVGAALAFSAIAWMLREVWIELTTFGQLALIGLLTMLLFGGGAALARSTSAPLQRLTSVLLLGGLVGAGWCTGILAFEVVGVRSELGAILVAATLTVLAVPLYLLRPRALPQVMALGAIVVLTVTLLLLPGLAPDPWVFGLALWAIGSGWLLASLGGFLPPSGISGVLGGSLALLGSLFASTDFSDNAWWWLGLGVLTAGALVGLALWRDTLHHLVVGSLGLFVLVPTLAFEVFGDTIGAPATLLVIGLLLVALAVGLGRAGREIRTARRSEGPPAAPRLDGGERP